LNKLSDYLESKLKKMCFYPNRLYICHETEISVEKQKNIYVIAMKGKRAVTSLVSAERGCLITVVTYMNAVGHSVPLMAVFPRKNMQI
jgi:hypothetical protein